MSALAAAAPRTDVRGAEAHAAELYERHRRAIFGFCYKQLRRREDADDAVQTTFIYALTSLRRGVVPELELPWLFTIARNVCSTRRRNGMRRGAYESAQDLDSVQDLLAAPERSGIPTTEDFTAVLRAIPENQRMALLLREWCGLSYDEIAAQLGLSHSATETLLFRARQNAAQRLEERTGLTAALQALQGLPFFSFLRNVLQSAAAKTLAAGAAAALTIAAVPGADVETHHAHAAAKSPAAVHVLPRRTAPSPTLTRPSLHASAVARAGNVAPPRRAGHVAVPRSQGGPVEETAPNTGRASDPAPSETASPATTVPTLGDVSPPMPLTVPTVQNVVDTAAEVDESLSLPAVSLPEVQTPTVPLPATGLALPGVHTP